MGRFVTREKTDNSSHRIAGVVLAAGESTRFGEPKQLAVLDGEPMIARVVRNVTQSAVQHTVIVLGYEFDKVNKALAGFSEIEIVRNTDYSSGLASSLKAGLRRVGEFDAIMFVLGDLPGLNTADINSVLGAYRGSSAPLAVGVCEGTPVHPVIFRKDLWPELENAGGDRGGRDVVKAHLHEAAKVELSKSSTDDIDTLEDYRRCNGGSCSE
jgi:molybdenum cofactor cytidylyltransferase